MQIDRTALGEEKEVWGVIILVVIFVAICLGILGYLLLVVPTKWVKVERVTWTPQAKSKILQISDIHIERNRATDATVKIVQAERPDYIFLTGDYLDTEDALPKLRKFLERLRSFAIPTYAVLGNHDYLLEDITPLSELMDSLGIQLLRNESVHVKVEGSNSSGPDTNSHHTNKDRKSQLDPTSHGESATDATSNHYNGAFTLIGIDDYDSEHDDIEAAFRHVNPDDRKFVFTHDPTLVLHLFKNYDALISGHLHGKQFNVPFLFRIQPMGPLAARGIYKGLHQGPFGNYYISKGLGQSGYNFRLFVRSEITIHYF